MKNFIEVIRQGFNYTININQIVWFSALGDNSKTNIILYDGTRFIIDEPYYEIAAKIEAATGE